MLPISILLRIAAIKCPLPHFPRDELGWNGTTSGKFTIKSAYSIRCSVDEGPNEDIWRIIMRYKGTQLQQIFLWMVCCDKIMTNSERVRRHFSNDARCGLCGADIEDVDHVLRRCPQAYLTWKELIRDEKIDEFLKLDIKAWVKCNLTNPRMFAKVPIDWELMFSGVCWYIWKSRNAVVFRNEDGVSQRSILEQARAWLVTIVAAGMSQAQPR
ncbi:hypothetical protein V6N13_013099 [Hibiscus sabdariffa]|uniref:Reverse transcriptase zinc-binding domain-containing protein n=1 Tax=Hibiscus sabdariffa TaxID=183260 RepID=A0ABR2SH86_9ROSI